MVTLVDAAAEADLLERTKAVVPELRRRAVQTAATRRIPTENIEALRRAGSLRALQSTRNGGYGLTMRAHLDIVATLAEGCGSTAWVAGVIQSHAWLLSHFPVRAQDDVFGADPDAVVAALLGFHGEAVITPTGFRLSGFWSYVSGNANAAWVLVGAKVIDGDGRQTGQGLFAVPTDAVTSHDDWFTTGLAGTGSSSISVEDLEVPKHRFLSNECLGGMACRPEAAARSAQHRPHQTATVPILVLALTGSAIGIARQAINEFVGLVGARTNGTATRDRRADHDPITQVHVGEAAMLVHEGALILYHCADQIDQAILTGTELDVATRARMRLDAATGVRRCLEGVEILVRATGGSALRPERPLTRAVNDLRAINQHTMLNVTANQELYGRVVLGLEPDTLLV